ncbi:MAG: DUF4349 domain-containing protein [Actinobacteria bacterium]|nr:MAG: DUF4349 domain-containing protein [Actinomycetota bacterium]
MVSRRASLVSILLALIIVTALALSGCQSLTGDRGVAPLPGGDGASSTGEGTGGAGSSSSKGVPSDLQYDRGGRTGESKEAQPASQAKTPPMVIRDKTLSMQVESVRKTLAKLNDMTAKYGATITNTRISSQGGGVVPLPEEEQAPRRTQDDNGPLNGTVVIKVPASKFDAFSRQARKLGKIQSESESAEDVTQQAVDMRARLKNLRAEEAAFLRFFRAAKTVNELIRIETQLARVRGEIESLQAQLELLQSRVALATLTLELSEPSDIVSPGGTNWGVGAAFSQAIRNFVRVVNFLIMMTGALLPLLILGALAAWVLRWFLRRFLGRKAES